MQLALEIDLSAASLQAQVFKQIHALILSGRLLPGTRLPGSRALSEQLGVSRNTIILVYETLIAEGYLESREGAGTYVARSLPDKSLSRASGGVRSPLLLKPIELCLPVVSAPRQEIAPREILYDFAIERTDAASFPHNVWRRLTNWRMRSSKFNLTYHGTPKGLRELRETIASYLGAARGIACSPEQIVIVTGVQQALNVAAHLFVRAGTTVAMEAPGCSATAHLFRAYGARILPVPIDQSGMMTKHLPQSPSGVAVVTPSRHYPMGYMLSTSRRKALFNWANQTDGHIVELDFDTEIRYEGSPPPALKGVDRQDRVVYLGSFSSSIGPGLRVGYMALPSDLVEPAVQAVSFLDHGFPCTGVPWLEQAVVNDFIESGAFDKHLRKIRRTYMARRNCLVTSIQRHFGSVQMNPATCGTHLVWELPAKFPSAPEVQELMSQNQVGVYTLRDRNIAGADYLENCDRFLLLGFASLPEPGIEQGVSRLAAALR
jgi:GntR family transcriptional regulator/MocR family aminotransferase